MARLPRLALADHTHLVLQCVHAGLAAAGRPLFVDSLDRQHYRHALFEAAAQEQVTVYAYALCDSEVRLLLNPATAPGLSRLMQALGRRYVGAHHRRHGGQGTLWEGRYRAAVLEPGPWRLAALRWVDGADECPPSAPPNAARDVAPGVAPQVMSATGSTAATVAATVATTVATPGTAQGSGETPTSAWVHSSAGQRLGARRDPGLQDPPEWWPLGNTPFEREATYRVLLSQGLPTAQAKALHQAARGGWAVGSAAFVDGLTQALGRPARPRPRGRPRKLLNTPAAR